MNTEKRPVLCTTLYRKPMQPSNFDGIFYQLRHWIFPHGFHQTIRFKWNFKKAGSSLFCQKEHTYSTPLVFFLCIELKLNWIEYDLQGLLIVRLTNI